MTLMICRSRKYQLIRVTRLSILPLSILCLYLPEVRASELEKREVKYLQGLSLEELMDVPISVSAKHESGLREAPCIVSVITAE